MPGTCAVDLMDRRNDLKKKSFTRTFFCLRQTFEYSCEFFSALSLSLSPSFIFNGDEHSKNGIMDSFQFQFGVGTVAAHLHWIKSGEGETWRPIKNPVKKKKLGNK